MLNSFLSAKQVFELLCSVLLQSNHGVQMQTHACKTSKRSDLKMPFTAAFLSLAELASTNSSMAHVGHPAKLSDNCIWEWFPGKKRNWMDSLLESVELFTHKCCGVVMLQCSSLGGNVEEHSVISRVGYPVRSFVLDCAALGTKASIALLY